MIEKCICGLGKKKHYTDYSPFNEEGIVWLPNQNDKSWHVFKLDNLRLIEDLAKEKGLI
jgi:hypothetical protein